MSLALDDALPLCPAAEALRSVRAAVAKGLRPDEASSAQLDHSIVAAICNWACACPRAQIASGVSSIGAAEGPARGTAQGSSGYIASLSAEPQRILFACKLLKRLSEASPGLGLVDMHRYASARRGLSHGCFFTARKQVLIRCPRKRSAIAAWLDKVHSSASVRLSHLVYQRCSQLLGGLAEVGLFKPITYVHWLVAHGLLAAASDRLRTGIQAAWHRCAARTVHHDLTDAVPSHDCPVNTCTSVNALSPASRYMLRQLHPQLVYAARHDGNAASVLAERRVYAHARATCLSPLSGAIDAANLEVGIPP